MNVLEILNEADLLGIGGLAYLYVPKRGWSWSPGMRPHVIYQEEPWPGYRETKRMTVSLPPLLEDALLSNGWTRVEKGPWWEYAPPEMGPDGLIS